ncbi:hypothetical protein SNEBB_003808 [Seison nebaliae]|nr:hypothetical protein SNEBB_003808 [Seison nebaliae]
MKKIRKFCLGFLSCDALKRRKKRNQKNELKNRYLHNVNIELGEYLNEQYSQILASSKYSDNYIRTTKYTIWTFIPKNLYEQFHRLANLYFLFIIVLNLLPGVQTFGSQMVSLPLIFVLTLKLIKDGFEDYRRYQNDKKVNNRITKRFCKETGIFEETTWKKIVVGDIVLVNRDEYLPADLLLISSRNVTSHNIDDSYTTNDDGKENKIKNQFDKLDKGDTTSILSTTSLTTAATTTTSRSSSIANLKRKRSETVMFDREKKMFMQRNLLNRKSLRNSYIIYEDEQSRLQQSHFCYVETANIDGETTLKQRFIPTGVLHRSQIQEDPSLFDGMVVCDGPNSKLYNFDGSIHWNDNSRSKLDSDNILLQGCCLRNTTLVYGIVIYSGIDTKSARNNKKPRYKSSNLEHIVNGHIAWSICILLTLCFICAVGGILFMNSPQLSMILPFRSLKSLPLISTSNIPLAQIGGFYSDSEINSINDQFKQKTDMKSIVIEFLSLLAVFVIVFQACVPMSLYVYLEIAKFLQVLWIGKDEGFFYKETGRTIQCKNFNIAEDLGHLHYIFTDKTGTLTENEMHLKKIALSSTNDIYLHYSKDLSRRLLRNPMNNDLHHFFCVLMLCNTVCVCRQTIPSSTSPTIISTTEEDGIEMNGGSHRKRKRHPVMIKYEGESPDELCLCEGASSYKYELIERTPDRMVVRLPDKSTAVYKLLHILSFSSQRKRMSTIVEDNYGRKIIYSKGADSIFLHSSPPNDNQSPQKPVEKKNLNCSTNKQNMESNIITVRHENEEMVKKHINNFAEDGYRVLCCAYRFIDDVEYEDWLKLKLNMENYLEETKLKNDLERQSSRKKEANLFRQNTNQTATTITTITGDNNNGEMNVSDDGDNDENEEDDTIENNMDLKADAQNIVNSAIERDLHLLGSVAIEDKLQMHVPETLHNLQQAGMKIVMLTGDKMETAISIGKSCNLIERTDLLDNDLDALRFGKRIHTKKPVIHLSGNTLYQLRESIAEVSFYDLDGTTLVVDGSTFDVIFHKEMEKEKKKKRRGRRKGNKSNYDGNSFNLFGKHETNLDALYSSILNDFVLLVKRCSNIICCRVSPLQKAIIVSTLKKRLNILCLAIGDGANDIGMIQNADVGIGIAGNEGMQAAMSSDFAIERFYMLERLILVHGHWCYSRLGSFVLYSLYKNYCFVMMLFCYQFFNGFSGQLQIEQFHAVTYSLTLTSIPPLSIALFDRVAPAEILLSYPSLYRHSKHGRYYNPFSFWPLIAEVTYQSMIAFFLIMYIFQDNSQYDIWSYATVSISVVICMSYAQFFFIVHTVVWPMIIGILLTIIVMFFGITLVYHSAFITINHPSNPYWVIFHVCSDPLYYLSIPFIIFSVFLPKIIYRAFYVAINRSQYNDTKYIFSLTPNLQSSTNTKVIGSGAATAANTK